jgi:hypothetical protein
LRRGQGRLGIASRIALVGALGAAAISGCGRSREKLGAPAPSVGGVGGSSASAGASAGGSAGTGVAGVAGGASGTAGTASGGTAGTLGEAGGPGTEEMCSPSSVPTLPVRRLSRFEYDNVMRDVFGDTSRPAQRLPYDTWTDVGDDLVPAADWVPGYHQLAHDFASEATRSNEALKTWLGCDDTLGPDPCAVRLLDTFLPRLFRRPLTPDEASAFEALIVERRDTPGGIPSGIRMALEIALQSPEFLYRPELGEPLDVPLTDPRAGWGRPTPFEMASRLSFLLWGSTPDDDLLREAAEGGLRTKEQVLAAAQRLLSDDRARDVIRYFHLRQLSLGDAPFRAAEKPENPNFTTEVAALLRSETDAFLDAVGSAGPGGFAAFVTAPYTYVNETLAGYYGIPDVTGPDLRQVMLSPASYSGILTQGSFLAANSTTAYSIPSLRGFRIAKGLLCLPVAPEPNPPLDPPPLPAGTTTRESTQAATAQPGCAGCHQLVDPIGFALEHFDQTGRYRDMENGEPIDAVANVTIGDQEYAVNGAAELGRVIAESPMAHDCYVASWAAYAYGTGPETPLDACSQKTLKDAFERTNGDIRALLLELTQTDAFLYRAVVEP